MKEDMEHNDNTIKDMANIMMGSSRTDKQISILVYLINKVHLEAFSTKKLEEILDLFVVIYLKCS